MAVGGTRVVPGAVVLVKQPAGSMHQKVRASVGPYRQAVAAYLAVGIAKRFEGTQQSVVPAFINAAVAVTVRVTKRAMTHYQDVWAALWIQVQCQDRRSSRSGEEHL